MLKQLKRNLKLTSYLVVTIVLTLGFSISLQSLLATWQAPTVAPPGNNIETPINEGTSVQTKAGDLNLDNLGVAGDLSVVGNVSGERRYSVNTGITTGVYDDTTSNSPYSRINADSLHTNEIGQGQLFLEGRAIDSNTWIAIGAGLAGGQAPQNVGIGKVAPGEKLDVNGNVQATGFFYSSDKALKENILELDSSLDKILKLRGVSFEWIDDDKNKTNLGLIAQEVEKVFPEIVKESETTGLKSVQYGNLVAPLIEAVKELNDKIDKLEDRLDKCESS